MAAGWERGRTQGLPRRFLLAFILQAALISVTAILGIWFARVILEEVLVQQALEEEAQWFWERRALDANAGPPLARNIVGFVVEVDTPTAALPPWVRASLANASEGLPDPSASREEGIHTVHVSRAGDATLVLRFDGEGVNLLTTYFGLVPLSLVLVALYLTAWVGYRASDRVLSPITALAREIRRLDLGSLDTQVLRQERFVGDPDEEVAVLAGALVDFTQRLDAFVERERNFTRDASHELRSPLTVISMAVETLRGVPELTAAQQSAIARIARATADMQEMVEAFLLLAREDDTSLVRDRVSINEIAAEELERARMTAEADLPAHMDARGELWMHASRQVIGAVLGNLIRNAFSHADGRGVRVIIDAGEVRIEDSGTGMPPEELARAFEPFFRGAEAGANGYGVGLTIVRRLSDRFGWPVRMASEPEFGTTVRITFPQSEFIAAPGARVS